MVSGAGHNRSGRRLVAWLLLTGFVVFVGWHAYGLLIMHSEFGSIERRLPELPPVHSVTHRREPTFPVKVWVHRVNSVERAVRMAKEYEGMEIDVVYDSSARYFDVGHPPTPSAGISLDRLLAAVPDIRNHYFWIDFRNLTDGNAQAACALLLSIARKYGVVSNMIVESINPNALSNFTSSGFYTSYYLFPGSELDTMNPEQLTAYYREVKANLASSHVNALSFSYRDLPFAAKYFPDADILTWYRDRDRNPRYYAVLGYLKRQSRVKVILVRQLSRGYR